MVIEVLVARAIMTSCCFHVGMRVRRTCVNVVVFCYLTKRNARNAENTCSKKCPCRRFVRASEVLFPYFSTFSCVFSFDLACQEIHAVSIELERHTTATTTFVSHFMHLVMSVCTISFACVPVYAWNCVFSMIRAWFDCSKRSFLRLASEESTVTFQVSPYFLPSANDRAQLKAINESTEIHLPELAPKIVVPVLHFVFETSSLVPVCRVHDVPSVPFLQHCKNN